MNREIVSQSDTRAGASALARKWFATRVAFPYTGTNRFY